MSDDPAMERGPQERERPTFRGSTVEGQQTYRLTPAQRKHQIDVAESEHRRAEEVKDNAVRRRREEASFYALLGTSLVILAIAIGIMLWGESDANQEWARSVSLLILGAFVGGLTGYVSGRSSR